MLASFRFSATHWVALALALCAGNAPGAIYKWVDEKGVTHYSEKPPAGKKPAEVPIRTQPAPEASQGAQNAQNAPKTWQQQEAEFQQRRVEQEERRVKKDASDQGGTEERLRACMQARQDLHVL